MNIYKNTLQKCKPSCSLYTVNGNNIVPTDPEGKTKHILHHKVDYTMR